jgi:hypothetical protein
LTSKNRVCSVPLNASFHDISGYRSNLLGVVVIAAWYTWRQDAADKAFVAACLAKDHAAAMYALGRTTDADFFDCIEIGETPAYRSVSSAAGPP